MSSESNLYPDHYFLFSFSFHFPVFADEVVKYHFLKHLGKTIAAQEYHALSFLLLDDELKLLAGIGSEVPVPYEQPFLELFRSFAEECPVPVPAEKVPGITVDARAVSDSPDELAGQIRLLHRIPVEKGIVRRERDYWWSDFHTFSGRYRWDFIDTVRTEALLGSERIL